MTQVLPLVEQDLAIAPLHMATLSAEDREAWHALAEHDALSAPFLEEGWVSAWIDAFRPREALLLGARSGDRLVGLAALQRLTESWAGQRIRVVQSLTNVECTRYDFLSAGANVPEQLLRFLCGAGRCDLIRLDHLPDESPTLATAQALAQRLGWRCHVEQTFDSPWRPLGKTPETWDEGLDRKFKSNLRNREKRLDKIGTVTFEVATASTGLEPALQAWYELDTESWKSQNGSAVFQQANVKAFYDRLVARAPERIWIALLKVNGTPAAAHFLLVHDGMLFLQKTAYSPTFAPLAPGQLLTARLIRHGIANGMSALDFLAANMTWKSDWEPRLRPHYRLMLFAPTVRGRYAYWTRYGWRERAKKIPGLQRVARALRNGGSS